MNNNDNKTKGQLLKEIEDLKAKIAKLEKPEASGLSVRKVEDILYESEQPFRYLAKNSNDLFVIIDIDGKVTYVSDSIERITGFVPAEVLGLSSFQLMHPDDVDRLSQILSELVTLPGEMVQDEFRFQKKGEGWIHLEAMVTNYLHEPSIKGIVLNIRDITGHKKAEEELKNSKELLQDLVDAIPDLIWMKDLNGVYLFCNLRFEQFFGAKLSDICGKTDYDFIDKELADFFRQKDNEAIAAGKSTVNEEEVVFANDGHREILETIKTPLYGSEGHLIGVLGVARDITGRKKADELQKEQAVFVQQNPAPVFRVDLSGTIISVNIAARQISKLFTEGGSVYEILKNLTKSVFEGMVDDEQIQIEETIGPKVYLFTIRKDPATKSIYFFGSDITGHKIAFKALNKSEAKFREIIENTRNIHYRQDFATGAIDYMSPSIENTLGYTPVEVIGMTEKEQGKLFHPDDYSKLTNFKNRLLNTDENGKGLLELRFRMLDKSGKIHWILGRYVLTRDIDGTPLHIVGVLADFTGQKLAEAEIRKFKTISDKSMIGNAIADLEGDIIYINEYFAGIHGYSPEWLIGKNLSIFHNQKHMEAVAQINRSLIESGSYTSTEVWHVHKNGTEFPMLMSGIVINDENGSPEYIAASAIDITEQKQAEQTLIKAKEQAEESDKLKSAFLTNISHEVRTPMNGITGFLDLIALPNLTGEKQEKYVNMIRKSSDRMLDTINDIMEISMIDSGEVKVVNAETNVNRQIEKIYSSFKQDAGDNGVRFFFTNTLSGDEAIINTDVGKLYSILENLIKNAIKFTKAGDIEFGYNLITDNGPAMLEFYVKDTGVGIPKNRQQAIFDRFVQADVSLVREFEGSGLGLAISKAYIEMLGGKIWVESEEADQLANKAGGSQFYFTLPYNCLTKKVSAGKIDTLRAGYDGPDKKLKVLVAEDDEANVMYLSMVLDDLCKEILYAKTGVEAVELCRNNPDIDLILMDVRMPEMDGLEAARQIREFNLNVGIVAQTAYALSGDREKSLKAGCNNYISKPIKTHVLIEIINELTGGR